MKPGPKSRVETLAVLTHYTASQSLRKTADAFGVSHERVRQIVLGNDPRALALWGSGGRTGSFGVMRGRSTRVAIADHKRHCDKQYAADCDA